MRIRDVAVAVVVVAALCGPVPAASARRGTDAPPSAPRSLAVSRDQGSDSLTLSWSAPASPGSSPILHYYARVDQGSYVPIDPGTTTNEFTGVDDGSHTVGVYATNAAGSGPEAKAGPPPAPRSLQATANYDGDSVELKWSAVPGAAAFPVTGYDILVSGAYYTTVTGGQTVTTVGGLTRGKAYTIGVRADNVLGSGPLVTRHVAVRAKPSPPSIGGAQPGRRGKPLTVSVTWQPPSSNGGAAITGYRVYLFKFNTHGQLAKTTHGAVLKPSATKASVKVKGFATYELAVEARNSLGWSFMSERSNPVQPG